MNSHHFNEVLSCKDQVWEYVRVRSHISAGFPWLWRFLLQAILVAGDSWWQPVNNLTSLCKRISSLNVPDSSRVPHPGLDARQRSNVMEQTRQTYRDWNHRRMRVVFSLIGQPRASQSIRAQLVRRRRGCCPASSSSSFARS